MRTDYVRAENLDVFSAIASLAFENEGRGAIVADVTSQPVPGAGHPFAYFNQETIEGQDDEDVTRIVAEYDPAEEFVVVLLNGRGDLFFLWHPGTGQIFSDYGLAMRPGSNELLAGLLMVDRPRLADPEWLAEVEATWWR